MSSTIHINGLMEEKIAAPQQFDDYERRIFQSAPELLRVCIEDNLTKTQKCYIMLYYKQGLSTVEIAKLFQVNKSTVSRTINRGRQRLMKEMRLRTLRASRAQYRAENKKK